MSSKKRRPISSDEAEDLLGGSGLLDRLGQDKPVSDKPKPKRATQKKQEKVKLSLYLQPEQLNALDELLIRRRRETGDLLRRNQLIEEAIQAYLLQHEAL